MPRYLLNISTLDFNPGGAKFGAGAILRTSTVACHHKYQNQKDLFQTVHVAALLRERKMGMYINHIHEGEILRFYGYNQL